MSGAAIVTALALLGCAIACVLSFRVVNKLIGVALFAAAVGCVVLTIRAEASAAEREADTEIVAHACKLATEVNFPTALDYLVGKANGLHCDDGHDVALTIGNWSDTAAERCPDVWS